MTFSFAPCTFLTSAAKVEQCPSALLPEVAVAGRSNVGKSSLLNFLTGQKKLARTSSRPGRTQTLNFFQLDGWRLVDLPGYGYARVSHAMRDNWRHLIGDYLAGRKCLAGVVLLVDSRVLDSPLDAAMIQLLNASQTPWVAALTKVDRFSRGRQAQLVAHFKRLPNAATAQRVMATSATARTGQEPLREAVGSLLTEWSEAMGLGAAPPL